MSACPRADKTWWRPHLHLAERAWFRIIFLSQQYDLCTGLNLIICTLKAGSLKLSLMWQFYTIKVSVYALHIFHKDFFLLKNVSLPLCSKKYFHSEHDTTEGYSNYCNTHKHLSYVQCDCQLTSNKSTSSFTWRRENTVMFNLNKMIADPYLLSRRRRLPQQPWWQSGLAALFCCCRITIPPQGGQRWKGQAWRGKLSNRVGWHWKI